MIRLDGSLFLAIPLYSRFDLLNHLGAEAVGAEVLLLHQAHRLQAAKPLDQTQGPRAPTCSATAADAATTTTEGAGW
ncbi:hypothetical protein WJX73_008215 [Symbiochloris irregularis]|uniref:Uncharacterized protein n=1 Tax=Symbiochloris irregularis TaxID=706552 RepID=A0AAW1PJ41_9CHLO